MSVADSLTHPSLLFALCVYGLLNLALVWTEHRISPLLSQSQASEWIAEHVLFPFARALVLLAFIAVSYPILFGLINAPSLAEVLGGHGHRISHLINVTFLVSLLLPFAPVIGAIPGFVLPIQGIVASAVLLSWLADAMDLVITLWPGGWVAGMVTVWAVLSHWLALQAATTLGAIANARLGYVDLEKAAYELIILALQAPAILLYTLNVGQQLTAFKP